MNANIIIVGVGGQGILLASKILGRLALDAGLCVKVSEVHGMAQRGGSVITHVRISGGEVLSPLVAVGEADYVLSFERLEALRARRYLKQGGVLIYNDQRVQPMPCILGAAEYPEADPGGVAVDALAIARAHGNERAVNIALLGVLARHCPWTVALWEDAIAACVPQKTLAGNLAAFRAGLKAGSEVEIAPEWKA